MQRPPSFPLACRAAAAVALSLLAVSAVRAQTDAPAPPPAHEPGRSGPASRPPELTLQAQAVSKVMQDTVTIRLAAEEQAPDQAGVGKKLTALLDATMKDAKAAKDIKARNGAYRLWAVTNRDGKVTGWRGRAEILLESKDFAAASELAGKLADRMPIDGIAFSLSDEARNAEEKRLLTQAANAFRDRALAAAQAFGFNGYRIRKLDLGGSGAEMAQGMAYSPAPMMASMQAKRSADVPLEADDVTVSVAVNGTVFLQ